jgi:hypothetical protein
MSAASSADPSKAAADRIAFSISAGGAGICAISRADAPRSDGAIRRGDQGAAYALKPDFYRRLSLVPKILPSGKRSTFGTRKKPIGGEKRIELALALDWEGLDARLFLHGFEPIVVDGDVEIARSLHGTR